MLSENIRTARLKAGYNQTELAKAVHVTQGAVSQWEKGLTRPDTEQLIAISQFLGISIDELTAGMVVVETEQKIDKRKSAQQIIDKLPQLTDEQLFELRGYIAGRFGK